ncbi:MAG TPA: hypothetical protein VNK43_11495, partial [Gemmatimonadales bacterium]|nr:hypothetical protein [Gemmatimonadales bacterium]
ADSTADGSAQRRGAFGLPTKYADLAIDGQARLEIRTDRVRNERCSPQDLLDPNSGCRGGFKAPRFDTEFTVLSGGVIGRRLHINVDYDSERDFSGRNDIQVYYEGLEDEIVRRVEVGTVTFRPPQSRFITAAIPANNFGVNATFELGAVELQTIAATQKGSTVAERSYTIGETVTTPQDRQVRDVNYESGRFFWVVDPRLITGYPAIDILELGGVSLPPSMTPRGGTVRIYRYRPVSTRNGSNPNLGGITAVAIRRDSPQRVGPLTSGWQLLIEGTDYYLDRSGLWFVLTNKLDQNDYLAVSYETVDGNRVGTLPVVDNPTAPDTLELIVEPNQGPTVPTFFHEMRQVYRVAGTDLQRNTLQVDLTVNRTERPLSGQASTYLQLLGLAAATDPNVFDVQNRLFPRQQDTANASGTVREAYIVFPHLQPFADPVRLTPVERSDSLYRTPQYLVLAPEGPPAKFELRLRYNAAGGGDRSTLDLNALQIREGSEQLTVNGLRLERGVDYNIDYELGQVTFLNPDQLFGRTGSAQVQARFEERGLFAVAPTTILGFSSRYSLGETGAVNLLGIYQSEKTVFNRPPLGFEPTANLIGGINTELHFRPGAVTRFLDKLVTGGATAPSRLDINAEYAFTRPDANRAGEAYLEEFEGDAGIEISLRETAWEFGSRPQEPDSLELAFGGAFNLADAVQLTWQNLVPRGGGDPRPVELRPQDIDSLIRVSGGAQAPETVMFLTLHADTAGGIVQRNGASRWSQPARPNAPRWRSMVTSLSSTGVDLSRNQFLEFWVFQDRQSASLADVRLIFDLGTVSEDAVALAPDTVQLVGGDSVFTGRQYVGLGKLDTERDPLSGIFNAQEDDIGILADRLDSIHVGVDAVVRDVPLCRRELSSSVLVFPWGDLGSRCSNGNGALDTEDLNSDNQLNASFVSENVFRYVVRLADTVHFVREGQPGWKLYRIPLSQADTIGVPNIRLVQHLRVTVAAAPDNGGDDLVAKFALARMRLLGSPWARRSETPIQGIAGATGQPHGEVVASTISTENAELGYVSPPGVGDQTARRDGSDDFRGVQINEKSLRVVARDLRPGERAEAYLRLPGTSQNLLKYREMRVWARGRGPGWEEGDFEAFVKLGSDNRNFYLYRVPARSTTWEPEMVVNLETWRRLRADVEGRWLRGEPPSGAAECGLGDADAYVACDGPYLVHLGSPGINPPNLAAVQEVSAGIYRVAANTAATDTEVWIDDIRLARPVSEIGTAVALDARLTASDVGNVQLSYVRQDGLFRQIGQDPSYRTTGALQLNSAWRLERFLPPSLGLAIPVTVSYVRNDVDPILLTGSDVRGDALPGLRKPESWTASYSLAVRRTRRGSNWLVRGLVDPLSLSGTVTTGRSQNELSRSTSDAYAANANYQLAMARRGPTLSLGGLVDRLPGWLRESEAGKGLRRPLLSLVPSSIRWNSSLSRNAAEFTSFQVPVVRPGDRLLPRTLTLSHLWTNAAGLTWQPLGMLTLSGDLSSTRDLRVYPDSSPLGRLAYTERKQLLGIPIGVERDRTLTTSLSLVPRVASWVRPRFTTGSSFVLARNLTSRPPVREIGDTAGGFLLPQTLNNSRTRELGASIDVARLMARVFGDSSRLARATQRFRSVDVANRRTRSSTFDLAAFDPGLGFMLGLGGLDRFTFQGPDSAVGVTETRTTTLSSGADLPGGFNLTLGYSLSKTMRLQRVTSGFTRTDSRQREWPVSTLRWTKTFRGGPINLLGAGLNYRRREGSTVQPSAAGATQSLTYSSSFTPDLQLGLRNGISLALGYSATSQRAENSGNATQSDQDDVTASFAYAFRLPASVSRIRKQVRTSLTAMASSATSCLRRRNQTACTTISDIRRRELRGGLDTDILRVMTGGIQFGYSLNDARHIDQRISQIFLSATFQLSLFSGDYR